MTIGILFTLPILFCILSVHQIQTCEVFLTSGWTITNSNGSIVIGNQSIPSGVYSALEEVNVTESVLHSFNDVKLRWIANENWTYSLTFEVSDDIDAFQSIVLVLHGIDTIAEVFLNGVELSPSPINMFVRYRFDVKRILKKNANELKIAFVSPIQAAKEIASRHAFTPPECPPMPYNGECHVNFLRKMQASFSWDWGLAAPSMGIWKPVVIEIYDSILIRDVNYALHLTDDLWLIDVKVFYEGGPSSQEGYLTVDIGEVLDEPIRHHATIFAMSGDDSYTVISFNISKSKVELWWPNGYGAQKLYTLTVSWRPENRDVRTNRIKNVPNIYAESSKSVRIGFRNIELVENNRDDGKTFFFQINGIAIFMKGTNWIPSHILPEKSFDADKVEYLLMAVKQAHMNMIRVWGGGIYETDLFYDLADELGILIWHDMMFACAMYPVFEEFLDSLKMEIAQNVRRIQNHPSIAIWAGNNENEAALVQNWYGTRSNHSRFVDEYIKLYSHIKDVVMDNDPYHIWVYSSPSNGNQNSSIINRNPQDDDFGDIHFYNYLSDGWNPSIFPRPRFTSEYGFQSLPSLRSWQSVLDQNDNLLELIEHRQHFPLGSVPIIHLIETHLPLPEETDERYAEAFIYFSQISQAMATKIESETYRIGRGKEAHTMGALYWQLNDVWVAPSWSSIDYNGVFKILHNWATEFFAPLHVIAHIDLLNNVNVYAIRDSLGVTESFEVVMRIFNWNSFDPILEKRWDIQLEANNVHAVDQFKIEKYVSHPNTRDNSFVQFQLVNKTSNAIESSNFLLLGNIIKSVGMQVPKLQMNILNSQCNNEKSKHTIDLEMSAATPAIFVYLQLINKDIERYAFSRNGFIQTTPVQNISVTFQNRNCATRITIQDFQILSVNEFMQKH